MQIQKLGKKMIIVGWLMFIATLYFLFNLLLNNNPNNKPTITNNYGKTEITLKPNAQNHYITSGFINGHKVTFLLDTGATTVAIPLKTAKRIGLKLGYEVLSNTANGIAKGWTTKIDTIRIADLNIHDVKATILENLDGNILLGMSALKQINFYTQNGNLILFYNTNEK